MSKTARVNSIETLKELRAGLCTLAADVRAALDDASAEVRRTQVWLQREQPSYWRGQVRRGEESVLQAKRALIQKQSQQTADGGRPFCVEERKALELAKKRLEHARQKLRQVQRWTPRFERELHNYRGGVQPMYLAVESDVPRAVARLDKMIQALEGYVALAPPTVGRQIAEPSSRNGGAQGDAPAAMARHGELPTVAPAPSADEGGPDGGADQAGSDPAGPLEEPR